MKCSKKIITLAATLLLSACQDGALTSDSAAASSAVESLPTLAQPLAANDVSILFPLPQTSEALGQLLSVDSLLGSDGQPVFPASDFSRVLDVAEGDDSRIETSSGGNRQITLTSDIRDLAVWKVAGIRFDPTAPGGAAEVRATFGSRPQIRLVLQPVTQRGEQVRAHDVALHLIYDFIADTERAALGSVGRSLPDKEAVSEIIGDLAALKALAKSRGIDTGGAFSVHPALLDADDAVVFTAATRQFLNEHLSVARLNGVAIMGLNDGGPEPWLFLSMFRQPPLIKQFRALPSPALSPALSPKFAQMVSFIDANNVQPQPQTTNRNPMSASLVTRTSARRGVSTAPLFEGVSLAAAAQIGVDGDGQPLLDADLLNGDIADWVANPEHSHFFNTDCVSCHSETTRRQILSIPPSEVAFQSTAASVDPALLPADRWNVRNFGWFRSQATITQRTANETAEVVAFINQNLVQQAAQ